MSMSNVTTGLVCKEKNHTSSTHVEVRVCELWMKINKSFKYNLPQIGHHYFIPCNENLYRVSLFQQLNLVIKSVV